MALGDSGQAGELTDVVITPQMIEAGASVIRMAASSADFYCEAEQIADGVLRAALEAQVSAQLE